MKILYLITKSEAGGAQMHVLQLARHFHKGGHKVLVMSFGGGWLEKELDREGIEFANNQYFSNSFNPLYNFLAYTRVKEILRDFKPDIVHCHSTKAGFLGRLAARKFKQVFFTAHGWAFADGTPGWRKPIVVAVEKIAAKFSEKIICVSEYDKQLALRFKIIGGEKLAIVHNGVKEQFFDIEKKSYEGKINIIFVGRLAKQKDPLLLLKGYNNLDRGLKDKTRLILIGDGPKYAELADFVEANNLRENVKLIGEISHGQVIDYLKGGHIFTLISNWEGFPYVIIEAMYFGLPVIASNVGGVSEAVDGSVGILLPKGEVGVLTSALAVMISDVLKIKQMGFLARKRVMDNFLDSQMFDKIEKIYRNPS